MATTAPKITSTFGMTASFGLDESIVSIIKLKDFNCHILHRKIYKGLGKSMISVFLSADGIGNIRVF